MNQDALLIYFLCLGVSVWLLKHFDPHKLCFKKIYVIDYCSSKWTLGASSLLTIDTDNFELKKGGGGKKEEEAVAAKCNQTTLLMGRDMHAFGV